MAKNDINSRRYREVIRARVLQRDAYICHYCGGNADHVDHIIARKHGGSNDMENLVAACASCNHRKGAKPVEVFLTQLATPLIFRDSLSLEMSTNRPNSPFTFPISTQSDQ